MSGDSPTSPPGASRLHWALLLLLVAAATSPIAWQIWNLRHDVQRSLLDRWIAFSSTRLSADERADLLRLLAAEMPGLFDAVPEPTVGRILQAGTRKLYRGAEVAVNNAGMRDERNYGEESQEALRVVCLGDSVTMGVGGAEDDRWCDQLEAALRMRMRPVGRPLEVYCLAVASWSTRNEASYLASRISSYRPDLVLALMVSNDIDSTAGVTGFGHPTFAFSPEHRSAGSGSLSIFLPFRFGLARQNLLASGLGEASQRLWRLAFQEWKRVEELLAQIDGRLMIAVMSGHDPLFEELVRVHHEMAGLTSPLLFTSALGHRLPHDSHPDRAGHAIIATHYLRALSGLGWLDLEMRDAPRLDERLSLATRHPPRHEVVAELQNRTASTLEPSLDFHDLREADVQGFLGGLFPRSTEDPLHGGVYGSLESIFLLRRQEGSRFLQVRVEVPARPELFPFRLDLALQGRPASTLLLPTSDRAGLHTIAAPLGDDDEPAVEVMLRTSSYWSEIEDSTMKSYVLLEATQE